MRLPETFDSAPLLFVELPRVEPENDEQLIDDHARPPR
jgi:hypothetical protein